MKLATINTSHCCQLYQLTRPRSVEELARSRVTVVVPARNRIHLQRIHRPITLCWNHVHHRRPFNRRAHLLDLLITLPTLWRELGELNRDAIASIRRSIRAQPRRMRYTIRNIPAFFCFQNPLPYKYTSTSNLSHKNRSHNLTPSPTTLNPWSSTFKQPSLEGISRRIS